MRCTIIRFLEMMFGITILCAGATMGILASLGETTSTAACSAISGVTGMKVGTAMIVLYSSFLILQILLLRKKFRLSSFIQLLPVFCQGVILNYFKYQFPPFQNLVLTTYYQRFIIFFIGMVFISMGFTSVKCSRFANYPPEAFCTLVSEKVGIRFGTCKIYLDMFYVILTLGLSAAGGLGFGLVREGTLIFAICNGIFINLFQPTVEKMFRYLDHTSEVTKEAAA